MVAKKWENHSSNKRREKKFSRLTEMMGGPNPNVKVPKYHHFFFFFFPRQYESLKDMTSLTEYPWGLLTWIPFSQWLTALCRPAQGFQMPCAQKEALRLHTNKNLSLQAHLMKYPTLASPSEAHRLSRKSYLTSTNEQSSPMSPIFTSQEKFS